VREGQISETCFQVAGFPVAMQNHSRFDASTNRSPALPAAGCVAAVDGTSCTWAALPVNTPPRPFALEPSTPAPVPFVEPKTADDALFAFVFCPQTPWPLFWTVPWIAEAFPALSSTSPVTASS